MQPTLEHNHARYDVLNDLTGVTEGSQSRSYTYDGMGRLTSSTTPEVGTVSSSYNSFNLVTSTTDARGVVATSSYDTLNRITGVSYNVTGTGVTGTSSVSYTYGTSSSSNNNGRVISMSDGTGSESYSYDILGRMTELDKVIGTTTYSTEYAYNLASEPTQITYPSGREVIQTYDAIGRLCGVGASGSTCSSGTTYASGIGYNIAGEMTGFTYGNGVVANLSYSPDRLQLQCVQYDTTSLSNPCTKDSSALFMLTYQYGSPGSNNGQISSITDGMDSGRNASYTYDGLGRLGTAATSGSTGYPAWGLSWTYDRYGNRTAQSVTAGSGPANSLTVNASTNQVTGTGFGYDASGNMTADGLNTLTYDAAAHLITSSSGTASGGYIYDGDGLRVEKCLPNCSSPTTTTVYIFAGGNVLAEYDNGAAVGSPSREYVYSSGPMIAKIAGGATTYYHQDHLSNRLLTNSSGGAVESLGHLPYGEAWYDTGSEKWKFTSYERDAESGNDYARARYHVNRLGRFSSPDPLSGSIGNPQSLNHYAYAGNNPINAIDPTGMDDEFAVCPGEDTQTGGEDEICISMYDELGVSPGGGGGVGGNVYTGSYIPGTDPADPTANEAAFAEPGGPGFGVVGGIPGMYEQMTQQQNSYVQWIDQIQTGLMAQSIQNSSKGFYAPILALAEGTSPNAFPPDLMGDITSVANPPTASGNGTKDCNASCTAGGKWIQDLLNKQPNNPLGLDTKLTSPTYTCSIQSQMGNIGMYTCVAPNGIVAQLTVTLSQAQKGCSGITTLPSVMAITGISLGNPSVTGCQ
jgi:RHS repeat-associated protein